MTTLMVTKGTLKINNGEIEFIKFGNGKRRLVVLPGLSYDGFFEQADAIANAYSVFTQEFTVYLIDRNLTPHAGYTVKDIARDSAEALKLLDIKKADVFGASLGGMVAQQLAISYPHIVNKLVLGSTLSRPNETFLSTLSRWEKSAISGEIDRLIRDINNTIYSSFTLKKYAKIFAAIKVVPTPEKTARFITYLNSAKNFDIYCSLDNIKAKTLVIGALKDKITTAAAARETANALNSKYFEYKRFGHAVFDEAKGYKTRIYGFLSK